MEDTADHAFGGVKRNARPYAELLDLTTLDPEVLSGAS